MDCFFSLLFFLHSMNGKLKRNKKIAPSNDILSTGCVLKTPLRYLHSWNSTKTTVDKYCSVWANTHTINCSVQWSLRCYSNKSPSFFLIRFCPRKKKNNNDNKKWSLKQNIKHGFCCYTINNFNQRAYFGFYWREKKREH